MRKNLQSSDILVFPSTRRGLTQVSSRIMTENYIGNIVRSVTDKDSFVVSDKNMTYAGLAEFVIHGRYFDAENISNIVSLFPSRPQNIYAYIGIDSVSVTYSQGVSEVYEEVSGQDLDGEYTGVTFTDSLSDIPSDTSTTTYYYIHLLEKDGNGYKTPEESKLKINGESVEIDGGTI